MAKESTSSRIPRLDGVSRIPSHIRASTFGNSGAKATQLLRASTISATQQRPNAAVLRPPMLNAHALKKSSSGDRLNNAVSLMSKKTTTAFKKFFSKPEKTHAKAAKNPDDVSPHVIARMTASTPRPLARSDTFVRSDSPTEMLGITHDVLVQSTPAPSALKRPATIACETTQLLSDGKRHAFYSTKTLSAEHTLQIADNTITLEGFGRTMNAADAYFGQTMCVNSNALDPQQTFVQPNVTKVLASTPPLGKTVCVNTPSEQLQQQMSNTITLKPLNGTQLLDKLINIDLTRTLKCDAQAPDSADTASPATNATYSNPGSIDNLQQLEDVSMPSGFDADVTLQPGSAELPKADVALPTEHLDATLTTLAPDKATMKLQLNSTMNTERLVNLTANALSPTQHLQMFDLTRDCLDTSCHMNSKNSTQLLYMTQLSASASTTPDHNPKYGNVGAYKHTPTAAQLMSPMYLKGAQSDLVLPTRTPDDDRQCEAMDVDTTLTALAARTDEFYAQKQPTDVTMSLQDVNNPNAQQKTRFSFGMDLTESTLDCSIELIDVSLSSTALSQTHVNSVLNGNNAPQSPSAQQQQQREQQLQQQQGLKKQNSFELDESLGILTPDQMKEFPDSANTNTNNLELPLALHSASNSNKLAMHQMRIDQTPSPEELPLDPVEVKTDITDTVLQQQQQHLAQQQRQHMQQHQQQQHLQTSSISTEPVSQHTDTELSKTDQMNKSNISNVSKISTSFITSVTSVTSLDTGYQGDGEMSRPASRGACDHSPSNGPATRKGGHVSRQPSFNQQQAQLPPIRRQDPMTDSDFFTESDADDIFHRGDRRAQVIDGQLYGPGPMLHSAASVFISEDPQMEDSCMESSGIFTDVENRCDEDLEQMRRQDTVDMSPDGECEGEDSTETVKSNRTAGKPGRLAEATENSAVTADAAAATAVGQGQLSCSQTSSTIQSSFSTDRLSAATLSNRTSYCSMDGGSSVHVDAKSFSSLEEAFVGYAAAEDANVNTKRTTNTTTTAAGKLEQQHESLQTTVQRVSSPRKHASLTSLCSVNNANAGAKTETQKNDAIAIKNSKTATGSLFTVKRSGSGSGDSVKSYNSLPTQTPRVKIQTAKSAKVGVNAPTINVRKPHTPNKWDAVMNKIASNKEKLPKRNYNEVKSKVSTRVSGIGGIGGGIGGVMNAASTVRRSPSSVSGSGQSSPRATTAAARALLTNKSAAATVNQQQQQQQTSTDAAGATQTKRLLLGATKRGRSYSKDSQKSSQSDLSLMSSGAGGASSPKLLVKTPLRAAKKRDVRNLSISPTDLGPPPKTQQTINGTTTRPKPTTITLTQKRFTANVQSVSASNLSSSNTNITTTTTTTTAASTPTTGSINSSKSSPLALKKHGIISKRLDAKTTTTTTTTGAKAPLKDHNRIHGNGQQTIVTAQPLKNGRKAETPTELQELGNAAGGIQQHNNNNNLATDKLTTTTTASARTNSQNTSPLLIGTTNQYGKKITNTTHASKTAIGKQQSQQQQNAARKTSTLKQQQHASQDAPTPTSNDWCLDAAELQELKLLNRHSCNGRLNYAALERHLQQSELTKLQLNQSVEAFGVLLQYLVYDLDAFSCPAAKTESAKLKECLEKTLPLLDEAKNNCTELQEQLCDKEAYYTQREEELQALHRCELEKVHATLSEFQLLAKEQISTLETKLITKDEQHKQALDCYRLEMDNKFAHKQKQLALAEEHERTLQERLNILEFSEHELRDKVTQNESSYAGRLQAASERELELSERVKMLTKELERLRERKESSERDLHDKLCLSHDEIAILRTPRRSINESMERSSSPRNSSSSTSAASEITRLQSEAESLRCVLELKQKEISKLTKQNEELMRDANERAALQAKISLLESRHEMLQLELANKSDKEKDYQRQIDEIQKAFSHETQKRTRLSYDNEALRWQLKQRSEQLHIVEAKLQELSTQDSLNMTSQSANRSLQSNGSSLIGVPADDVSPPTSPIIKGVIEKTDSVSWVLEMDDETPEVAASKMVKRAGSFRSVERSPSTRRQLSVSASAATTSIGSNGGIGAGPNPLSQSMSATSVIRQHSSDNGVEFANRAHARIRSKSVSVKGTEPPLISISSSTNSSNNKKVTRPHSSGNTRKHELMPISSKSPLSASSPYGMRPRTSTMKMHAGAHDCEDDLLFRRSSSARKLITCDTSALNTGERLEMHALPTHASVHDLKVLKKCQQIQESAGEAMVSGTNSEDEGCSASSDEIVSSASTASATSGSTSSLHNMKNSQMSLEEVLLQANSLNGTPMEVSWSDDVEVFANGTV